MIGAVGCILTPKIELNCMKKNNNQSRIISFIFLSILLAVGVIASCHHKNRLEVEDNKDTVAAKEFAPLVDNGKLSIDLKSITSVAFPKYKLSKATPFIPDSVSIAADEETVSSGNYSATLLLDTIPSKTFYQSVETAAQHDTCWHINNFAFTYEHKDKQGGVYKVSFSKGGQQIFVTHLNSDMVGLSGKEK